MALVSQALGMALACEWTGEDRQRVAGWLAAAVCGPGAAAGLCLDGVVRAFLGYLSAMDVREAAVREAVGVVAAAAAGDPDMEAAVAAFAETHGVGLYGGVLDGTRLAASKAGLAPMLAAAGLSRESLRRATRPLPEEARRADILLLHTMGLAKRLAKPSTESCGLLAAAVLPSHALRPAGHATPGADSNQHTFQLAAGALFGAHAAEAEAKLMAAPLTFSSLRARAASNGETVPSGASLAAAWAEVHGPVVLQLPCLAPGSAMGMEEVSRMLLDLLQQAGLSAVVPWESRVKALLPPGAAVRPAGSKAADMPLVAGVAYVEYARALACDLDDEGLGSALSVLAEYMATITQLPPGPQALLGSNWELFLLSCDTPDKGLTPSSALQDPSSTVPRSLLFLLKRKPLIRGLLLSSPLLRSIARRATGKVFSQRAGS